MAWYYNYCTTFPEKEFWVMIWKVEEMSVQRCKPARIWSNVRLKEIIIDNYRIGIPKVGGTIVVNSSLIYRNITKLKRKAIKDVFEMVEKWKLKHLMI